MPGIVGIITKRPREWAEPQLRSMVEAMRHEPFYVTGTWIDESLGVYVGWIARKGSFCDGMPLCNERADVVLVFAGEDFAESSASKSLGKHGDSPRARGPRYLLGLSEEDPTFPAGLNGTFQGIVIDKRRGTATLFNDRYGMHRVCFHEDKQAFYFAAEAKAILAVRSELATPDFSALGEFVSYGCVLKDRTIFRGINVLPCAAAWVFRQGSIAKRGVYFRAQEWEEQEPLEPESYYQELRKIFSHNLPRYFNGPEKVGMTVTGGLDTRLIMAWHNASPGSLPCYTFGGPFRDPQDVKIARRVADICQQPYEVIRLGHEFLSRFPHYAERSLYLMEGRVDVYRSTDLYVSERAREIAPVKIVGTFGSEIIRRAVMFKPTLPQPGLYRPDFLSYVREADQTYADVRRGNPVSFAAFRQAPWFMSPVSSLEEMQLTVRTPYLDNDFVRTIFRAPRLDEVNDVRLRMIADGNPTLGRIRTDLGVGGASGRLLGFASRSLHKFTFKAEYAYDYGMPQWVAQIDHVLSPLHMERLFLGRHKLSHFRIWYRDVLADYVRELLLDSRTLSRPYLERKGVEAIVHGHLKGGRNYTREIHKLMTLELLHRLFFDAASYKFV